MVPLSDAKDHGSYYLFSLNEHMLMFCGEKTKCHAALCQTEVRIMAGWGAVSGSVVIDI